MIGRVWQLLPVALHRLAGHLAVGRDDRLAFLDGYLHRPEGLAVELTAGGEIDGKSFRAVEIPVEQREPIIAAYREVAGRSVTGYWKKLPDPADHPVFRIDLGST